MSKKPVIETTAANIKYATAGSAGIDLPSTKRVVIMPHEFAFVETISLKLPDGFAGLIKSRSGVAFKSKKATYEGQKLSYPPAGPLTVFNGLIDSDYTGVIKLRVMNEGAGPYVIDVGECVAQLVPIYAPQLSIRRVDNLTIPHTGEHSGFGSTG